MKVLVVNDAEVVQLLPMAQCIEAMEEALSALARGQVLQPLRTALRPANADGLMVMMPAFRAGQEPLGAPLFGLKAICVFPGNAAISKDAHQGGVLLFSGETGELLTVINASAITSVRTAAVSAAATRLLARADAENLAIIGAGVQARSHLQAMSCVRSIARARIAARRFESAQLFAHEMQAELPFPIEAV